MISSVHTTRNSAMWMYKTPSYHKMTASLRRIKNDQAKLTLKVLGYFCHGNLSKEQRLLRKTIQPELQEA